MDNMGVGNLFCTWLLCKRRDIEKAQLVTQKSKKDMLQKVLGCFVKALSKETIILYTCIEIWEVLAAMSIWISVIL